MTGCKINDGIATPTATVEGVRVVRQSEDGASLQVTVRMENPNTVALPLKNANFTLVLTGIGEFSFIDTPHVTLPAKRTDGDFGPGLQFLNLAAAIATEGKDTQGAAYRVRGSIIYEPPGEIRRLLTESSVPLPAMNFSQSGTLD